MNVDFEFVFENRFDLTIWVRLLVEKLEWLVFVSKIILKFLVRPDVLIRRYSLYVFHSSCDNYQSNQTIIITKLTTYKNASIDSKWLTFSWIPNLTMHIREAKTNRCLSIFDSDLRYLTHLFFCCIKKSNAFLTKEWSVIDFSIEICKLSFETALLNNTLMNFHFNYRLLCEFRFHI